MKKSVKKDKIDSLNANSKALSTQYCFKSSQLIKSFTKNILFVLIVVILVAAMTIFDLIINLGFINNLPDETIDAVIIVVSIFLILFLVFTVKAILRSQKVLDKWSNLFENNVIRTSIILTINNNSKEEILHALSEIIEEIAIPLQHYLAKSNHHEFYDVRVNDTTTIFDILIDKATIKPTIDSDSLNNTVQNYGSIAVKITENAIDKNITQIFIESLQQYQKKGNKIGLAILIGKSIDQKSYNLVNKIKDKNINENLILIEKA
ncbi:MAG: hypothetical protein ACRD8K_07430 [Nitrososphaeraceae archaeon]